MEVGISLARWDLRKGKKSKAQWVCFGGSKMLGDGNRLGVGLDRKGEGLVLREGESHLHCCQEGVDGLMAGILEGVK